MAMASCSQTRSFSPTHAAIMAKYALTRGPLIASFPVGKSARLRAGLRADDFLVLCARGRECHSRSVRIIGHAGDNSFDYMPV